MVIDSDGVGTYILHSFNVGTLFTLHERPSDGVYHRLLLVAILRRIIQGNTIDTGYYLGRVFRRL